jgi:ferritin
MLISAPLAQAINTQIDNEFAASLQYDTIAAHFHRTHLRQLAKLCFAQGVLQWFVDEQLEDVTKMQRLLEVIRMAGERNLFAVEAYLVHAGS